ncbi:MAG: hypothetical protein P1P64_02690 [Treponemataceae bacterium]
MTLNDIYAKIRNIFNIATFKKREDRQISVETDFLRTLEAEELFPYGFFSKATKGRVVVLSQGGNAGSFVLLPVSYTDGVPDLKDGDVSVWAEDGANIIVRADKTLELNGTDYGGLIKIEELKKELEKINAFLRAFVNVLKVPTPEPGNGSPSAFQAVLNSSLSSMPFADFSQIENDKVKHGQG